jgi:MtN3 and saliva related transmembrane protein
MLIELAGILGSLIVCASAVPQIAKTLTTRRAGDISLAYLIVLMAGIALLTLYALHIGDPVFVFSNLLSVASTGILIALRLRFAGPGHGRQG